MWKRFRQKQTALQSSAISYSGTSLSLPATHPLAAGATFSLKLHSSDQLMVFRMPSLQTQHTPTSLRCPAEKLHILGSVLSLPKPPVQPRGLPGARDTLGLCPARSSCSSQPLSHTHLQEHNTPPLLLSSVNQSSLGNSPGLNKRGVNKGFVDI